MWKTNMQAGGDGVNQHTPKCCCMSTKRAIHHLTATPTSDYCPPAPARQTSSSDGSPHDPDSCRKKLVAQTVQLLPDVHVVQLAGQLTQFLPTATVLDGQTLTVRLIRGRCCCLGGARGSTPKLASDIYRRALPLEKQLSTHAGGGRVSQRAHAQPLLHVYQACVLVII